MAKSAINFIQKRKLEFPRRFMNVFAFRASPQVFMGAFLVIAGLLAGAFYILKFKSLGPFAEKPEWHGQVAGAACESGKLPKEWVQKYFGTEEECDPKIGGAEGDPDADGLDNLEETIFLTDPTNPDTDGDGHLDGLEVAFNRDPKGEGFLNVNEEDVQNYMDMLDEGDRSAVESVEKNFQTLFQPDREIVLDLPDDEALAITEENSRVGFEKYYNDTKDLKVADEADVAKVSERLFELEDYEINLLIGKYEAIIKELEQTPIPSAISVISKLRIAQLRAGVRMFELVRDSYDPDSPNTQFWADYFYQMVAARTGASMEVLAWKEMFDTLKDTGGL